MPGGAVALDGRIEPGDMILQVNEMSFENFSNDQAVEVLKDAVNKRGYVTYVFWSSLKLTAKFRPIKLTVAKSFDAGRANYFAPSREPVRPIDTHAWVQHINAVRGMTMNAIPEGGLKLQELTYIVSLQGPKEHRLPFPVSTRRTMLGGRPAAARRRPMARAVRTQWSALAASSSRSRSAWTLSPRRRRSFKRWPCPIRDSTSEIGLG